MPMIALYHAEVSSRPVAVAAHLPLTAGDDDEGIYPATSGTTSLPSLLGVSGWCWWMCLYTLLGIASSLPLGAVR